MPFFSMVRRALVEIRRLTQRFSLFEPETLRMQVRQEAAALLVVGVRDAISDARLLTGHFADAGHTDNLEFQ